jgi:putative restriction endonuclease
LLVLLSRSDLISIRKELAAVPDSESEYEIELEIRSRHFEGDLEKVELTKSRRGQGIFRANVRQIERKCRVTGLTTFRHLRASHIKPWAKSNDQEKIDGANGLLLSPHIDHLFDRGFISFGDEGEFLVSRELNLNILDRWGIDIPKNVGTFLPRQHEYLEYHRERIFENH